MKANSTPAEEMNRVAYRTKQMQELAKTQSHKLYTDEEVEQLIQRKQLEAEIKLLSHVLVYGATGKKQIGLNRQFVVSELATLQTKRAELEASKGKS